MLKKQPQLPKKQTQSNPGKTPPNPTKTNMPQQTDPQHITTEKKTSDLEALISGQERTQIRMNTQNRRPEQPSDIDRSSLLQTLPNPFRDTA